MAVSSIVEAGYAAALRAESLLVEAVPPAGVAWGDRGRVLEVPTPFATPAGAAAEARRVAAFFAAPLVVDRVPVTGEARALKHRCIRLEATGLDYAPGGDLVFVLGVDEQDNGTSLLTVLKRLA